MTRSEMEAKLEMVRRRLGEIREYKRLLATDGLQADAEDKRRETELIRQVLWLEKKLGITSKPTAAGGGVGKGGPRRGERPAGRKAGAAGGGKAKAAQAGGKAKAGGGKPKAGGAKAKAPAKPRPKSKIRSKQKKKVAR